MPIDVPHCEPCDACEGVAGGSEEDWVPVESLGSWMTFVTDRPRADGAVLIVPRRHVPTVLDLTTEELVGALAAARRVAAAIRSAMPPDGFHVWTSSGRAAGQSLGHMHFQVAPRYESRPYSFAPSHSLPVAPYGERLAVADRLRAHLPPPPDAVEPAGHRLDAADGGCPVCAEAWPTVFENSTAACLMPDRARAPGAVVVSPRRHVDSLLSLPEADLVELAKLCLAAASGVREAVDPDGLNLWTDIGPVAGQEMDHLCVEIAPRWADRPYHYAPRAALAPLPAGEHRRLVEAVRECVCAARRTGREP